MRNIRREGEADWHLDTAVYWPQSDHSSRYFRDHKYLRNLEISIVMFTEKSVGIFFFSSYQELLLTCLRDKFS